MQTKRPRVLSRSMVVALLLSSVSTLSIASEQKARIFNEPPPPEVLAEILFPPRYRSVTADGSTSKQREQLFGVRIQFEFDSAKVLPESEPLLASVGEMMGLETLSGRAIMIEGHTDAVGDDAYNQRLSERRARAIRSYLINKFGIAPKRMVAVGKGERDLYEKSDPRAAVNRRAMFRPMKKLVLK